jgi:hypothetical protein
MNENIKQFILEIANLALQNEMGDGNGDDGRMMDELINRAREIKKEMEK